MTTLHLTEEQLRVVQQALDLYSRVGIGQFERIKYHPTFVQHLTNQLTDKNGRIDFTRYHEIGDEADEKLMEARNILIQEDLHPNTSWGIFNEKGDESCRVAYDIIQVIRHEFWKANPNRSELTVDAGVNLQTEDGDKIKCELNRTDALNTITFNGLEYKEVRSKTSRIWLDRNLGAKRVAESSDDSEAYGNYYTFDEIDFPDGYRLPTEEEWEAELKSWESKNSEGAFKSPLKLPASGYRDNSSGDPFYVGSNGCYWLGSVSNARYLDFCGSFAVLFSYIRANGLAVRLIKE